MTFYPESDDVNHPLPWPSAIEIDADELFAPIPPTLRRDVTHDEMKRQSKAKEAYLAAQLADTERIQSSVSLMNAMEASDEMRRRERIDLAYFLVYSAVLVAGGIGAGLGLSCLLR